MTTTSKKQQTSEILDESTRARLLEGFISSHGDFESFSNKYQIPSWKEIIVNPKKNEEKFKEVILIYLEKMIEVTFAFFVLIQDKGRRQKKWYICKQSLSLTTPNRAEHKNLNVLLFYYTFEGGFWIEWKQNQRMVVFSPKVVVSCPRPPRDQSQLWLNNH